ncbi:MAG: CcmD family protein [Bacteroidetes bacterium]|nr:MAG: CcmD family protein [Bacteroidota bacterium]
MLKVYTRIALFVVVLISSINGFAQGPEGYKPVDMADGMRSNGKIYVVVAVLGIIMLGLLLFLTSMDRKLKKLEKENKK